MFQVRFVYLGKSGERDLDKVQFLMCHTIPRVGELFRPTAGSPVVVVKGVLHEFPASGTGSGLSHLVTVILFDASEEDRESLREALME